MKKIRMICLAAIAAAALAQGPGPGAPMPPSFDELKAYLSLTDAQVQGLAQIRTQERAALDPIYQEIQQKQRTLREQTRAGSTDAAALGRLLVDIQNLNKRADDARKSFHDQAVNALTTEQKTKLKALEDVVKLQPAIGQAVGLNLLTPPAPPAGDAPGGPGGPGRGPGRFGPRGRAPGAR